MTSILNSLFKNPKTTIGGAIAAVGTYLQTLSGGWVILGQILAAVGVFLIGAAAKDSNVTGGTKPQTPEAVERTEG